MNAQPLNRKRQVQTLWHTVVRTVCSMELVGRQFGTCNQHLRGSQRFGMTPIEVAIDTTES